MALLIGTMSLPAAAERIRDLVTVQGVRDNALIGYGTVWWGWTAPATRPCRRRLPPKA